MSLEQRIQRFLKDPDSKGFEDLALTIYRFQFEQNSAYRQYCRYSGVDADIGSWKEIPAVPQIAFKRSRLISFPEAQVRYEFRTSGTTGEGFGRHWLPSLELYRTAVEAGWNYFGLPREANGEHPSIPPDAGADKAAPSINAPNQANGEHRPAASIRFIMLMQHPRHASHSSLSWMGAFLAGDNPESFFLNERGAIEFDRLLAAVRDAHGPLILFGTALAFLNLLELVPHLPLPAGSLVMETGGFKGSGGDIAKHELYGRLQHHFGVSSESVWNEYGMTELSSQFYSCSVGRSHFAPPWLRFVVVDPATNREAPEGATGLLKVIDLANLWSVLAIQTQDLAVRRPDGGFLLLGRDPAALPRGCSRAVDELLRGKSLS
jgi:hypothetical protein